MEPNMGTPVMVWGDLGVFILVVVMFLIVVGAVVTSCNSCVSNQTDNCIRACGTGNVAKLPDLNGHNRCECK